MTSAITRAPAGAAHAHGFAKSPKGDAPAEGFEALLAAVAGAQPMPAATPVVANPGGESEQRKPGEGARDEDRASPQALLIAAMTLVPPDAKALDPRTVPAAANSQAASEHDASAPARTLEIARASSMPAARPPSPASQTIVPNAAFATSRPDAHALIAHKAHVAEGPVPATADPPRSTRAPIDSEKAASPDPQRPAPVGAPAPSHAEAKPLSTAPPSSQPETPVERPRNALSPRALVQAAMVEVVRSPGRGRTPPPNAANTDAPEATPIPAEPAAAARPPAASAQVAQSPIVEQAVIAEAAQPIVAPAPGAKPTPTSRAAADIARQRQFVLGATPASASTPDAPAIAPAFETLIALGKADGTLEGRAEGAPDTESVSPSAPAGAWLPNLPASSAQTLGSASAIAAPRTFDQAAWSAALAQQVTAAAVAATRETTVRIEPDGLGPIEVRVRVGAEHVDVRFAIEHPVTVNMVREALPDLQRMLAQSGLHLGDAQVAQQNAGGRGQAARGEAPASRSGDDEPVAAIGATVESRPRTRVGLLDDFV